MVYRKKKGMGWLDMVFLVLLIVGGLVHGINAIMGQNPLNLLLGDVIARVVMGLVGIVSVIAVWTLAKMGLMR